MAHEEQHRFDEAVRAISEEASVLFLDMHTMTRVNNKDGAEVLFKGPASGHPIYERYVPVEGGAGELITVSDTGLDWRHCFFGPEEPRRLTLKSENQPPPLPRGDGIQKVHAYAQVEYSDGLSTWRSDFDEAPGGHGRMSWVLQQEGDHGCTIRAKVGRGKRIGRMPGHNSSSLMSAMLRYLRSFSFSLRLCGHPRLQLQVRIKDTLYVVGRTIYRYTFTAREIDEFVYTHPDYVVVVANGNEGRFGPYSVGSPATAMNVIAVGASSNSLQHGNVKRQAMPTGKP